jgi:hypothetical protein
LPLLQSFLLPFCSSGTCQNRRQQQNRSLDQIPKKVGKSHELHGIVENAEGQNAGDRSKDRTLATDETDAAQDRRSQAVKLDTLAGADLS